MSYEGSIDLIGGLRPKNNGNFKLVNMKDVYQPVETALPTGTGSTLQTGVMYFLKTPSAVIFGLPEDAEVGEMVYVSFQTSADTIPLFQINTDNHTDVDITPEANKVYEIMGVYNGSTWVMVTHEVSA